MLRKKDEYDNSKPSSEDGTSDEDVSFSNNEHQISIESPEPDDSWSDISTIFSEENINDLTDHSLNQGFIEEFTGVTDSLDETPMDPQSFDADESSLEPVNLFADLNNEVSDAESNDDSGFTDLPADHQFGGMVNQNLFDEGDY